MSVAVITGASAGVGRAAARAFADAGFDVGRLARGRSGLDAAAREVEKRGRRAVPIVTDVARWDDVVQRRARDANRTMGDVARQIVDAADILR